MLPMELCLKYIQSHTYTDVYPFCSLFLSPSSTTEGRLLHRALKRKYIPSFRNDTSLIIVFPLLCLSFSPFYFNSGASLSFLSLSRTFFFSCIPHIYHILSFALCSSFSPPVSGLGNSLCILRANRMTHYLLITSSPSYSSTIILLVYTT